MRKVIKLMAMLFGVVALVVGSSSCKDDDDDGNDGNECCTFTYTDNGVTYIDKACEDGTRTYSYTGGETYTYDWRDDYSSWSEVKAIFEDYGGTCN